MTPEAFRKIAPGIPHLPGVYKYLDQDGRIIYIGKAKDLRKRVSSYFSKTYTGYKTHELVIRIHRIDYTVVNSEQDAFFLENALIKEYQPKYNIDLKDDKSYPYIVIKKEPFPRVFLTRRKINDGSEYLGPFTSVARVRELLQFIRQHIPLRTCKLNLSRKSIEAGKFKVCLEYHLGNCLGPCTGLQSEEGYQEGLLRLKQILKGKLGEIIQYYKEEMQRQAANLEFEKALVTRKKLEHLQQYQANSVIVSKHTGDVDVFTLLSDGGFGYVNYLMVRNGTIVQTHTIRLKPQLDETEAELLPFAVAHIRSTFGSDAPEVIVPFPMEYPEPDITVTIPKAGEKKKLLDLSYKNVQVYLQEVKRKMMLHIAEKSDDQLEAILQSLKTSLRLPELPQHIECFDNSNFQGSYPVSAMVCFKHGRPSKNDYRKFNIKTVTGIDDFASMKEAVYRRYKRDGEKPQLVIIDGGKGQLNAALEAIEALGLSGTMTFVGLAKNKEELFFPGDRESIQLNWNDEGLKLIRRIRDEVHRFGVSFHRQKRSKGSLSNELETIPGIGKQTAATLLIRFKSLAGVKAASPKDIEAAVGTAKAEKLRQYFSEP